MNHFFFKNLVIFDVDLSGESFFRLVTTLSFDAEKGLNVSYSNNC